MSALAKRMTRTLRTAIGGGLLLAAGLVHAGTVHYYYTDPQGTVLAKADAQGAIVARYDYAPYGTSAPNLDAAPAGPGYTGHVNDPDTGLVYMQARYYDPVVGRFLSVDPVAPVAGDGFNFNRYAYADNSPIVHDDPTGAYTTPVSNDDRNRGAADTGIEGNNAQDDGGDSLNQSRESATGKPAVSGNKSLDKRALSMLNSLSSSSKNETAVAGYKDGSTAPIGACTPSSCQQQIETANIALVAHLHKESTLDDSLSRWVENQMRELQGPKDADIVKNENVPNYFRTPTGAVRVVERNAAGHYYVRTVVGKNFKYQKSYVPGANIPIEHELSRDYDNNH